MDIIYNTFKEDCKTIIEPAIEKYGYLYDHNKSESFINYYYNKNNYIEISMLENFPHIGVSWRIFDNDLNLVNSSHLNSLLKINQKEKTAFYIKYKSEKNLVSYADEMRYTIAVLEKFYKPILTGEIKIQNI